MSSVVSQAPRLTVSTAEKIAEEKYGICGEFRRLPSERDQNFHIRSKDKHEYVLKIANQTEEKEALDFQNQAMIHVHHQKELFTDTLSVCPEVYATRKKELIDVVVSPEGNRHFIRMLSYLP